MNDSTLTQLKILVERAVRPVQASTSRKRKMREEMLAHVSAVFAEEAAKPGDDRAALERTALRFGDPAELMTQLQESVPASDGFSRFFDFDGPREESALRNAMPLVRVTAAAALAIVLIGACFAAGWWKESPGEVLLCGAIFLVVGPSYAFGLALIANRMEKALTRQQTQAGAADHNTAAPGILAELHGPSGRSRLWMALFASACLTIVLCIAVGLQPPESLEYPTAVLFGVMTFVCLTADSAILVWFFANSAAVRRRHSEEWSRLPIEPAS